MVEQAARCSDEHVGTAVELAELLVEGHAADEQRHGQFVVLAVAVEVFLHLRGQFARRLQDQRARHAGPRAALLKQRKHGQHEGGCLAGAGLGDAHDVTAFQHMRNGLFLNRGRGGVAGGSNCIQHLFAQSERVKCHVWASLLVGWCWRRSAGPCLPETSCEPDICPARIGGANAGALIMLRCGIPAACSGK